MDTSQPGPNLSTLIPGRPGTDGQSHTLPGEKQKRKQPQYQVGIPEAGWLAELFTGTEALKGGNVFTANYAWLAQTEFKDAESVEFFKYVKFFKYGDMDNMNWQLKTQQNKPNYKQ